MGVQRAATAHTRLSRLALARSLSLPISLILCLFDRILCARCFAQFNVDLWSALASLLVRSRCHCLPIVVFLLVARRHRAHFVLSPSISSCI